jgi:hypothetical protein
MFKLTIVFLVCLGAILSADTYIPECGINSPTKESDCFSDVNVTGSKCCYYSGTIIAPLELVGKFWSRCALLKDEEVIKASYLSTFNVGLSVLTITGTCPVIPDATRNKNVCHPKVDGTVTLNECMTMTNYVNGNFCCRLLGPAGKNICVTNKTKANYIFFGYRLECTPTVEFKYVPKGLQTAVVENKFDCGINLPNLASDCNQFSNKFQKCCYTQGTTSYANSTGVSWTKCIALGNNHLAQTPYFSSFTTADPIFKHTYSQIACGTNLPSTNFYTCGTKGLNPQNFNDCNKFTNLNNNCCFVKGENNVNTCNWAPIGSSSNTNYLGLSNQCNNSTDFANVYTVQQYADAVLMTTQVFTPYTLNSYTSSSQFLKMGMAILVYVFLF